MQENEFLMRVQRRAGLDTVESARDASNVVLETLGERITAAEVEDLAAQLPQGLTDPLTWNEETAESLSTEAFVGRVDDRTSENAQLADAGGEPLAKAVLSTVDDAVTSGEAGDVRTQLPASYDRLFDPDDVTTAGP